MSENTFISRELQENLLESLLVNSCSSTRSEIVKKYLEDISNLANITSVGDFKQGLEWMNVKGSLSFKSHLKGKIVLLDFFTYCCINCMHVLPDLKFLEDEYKVENGLVVIGVHSPKFPNEKETKNVAEAVKRYEIAHPVVNDSDETMWRALHICCWPTVVIVGPSGEILLELMGEGHRELLHLFVGDAIKFYKLKGVLSESPLPQILPFYHTPQSNVQPLRYPGKIDVVESLVAIADTGNHRVIVTDFSGHVKHIVGGPESGFHDGNFNEARFNSLQGVVFYNNSILFVADTKNHAIRQIDLINQCVRTVAGTGHQGAERLGGKIRTEQAISSPWDVCIHRDVLYIAMAGTHQIWALMLSDNTLWSGARKKEYKEGQCVAVAGSGREENRNNAYPMSAGLAQPSGLCYSTSCNCLYIADSESSTVRSLNLSDGKVAGVMGGAIDPKNLFAFGDVVGHCNEVKLQHPLCVAWSEQEKTLYVADTYNHKIKCRKPTTELIVSTLMDTENKPFQFNEPGGLCVFKDNLYVADTNNHQIVVINLKTKERNTFNLVLPSTAEDYNKNSLVVATSRASLPISGGGTICVKATVVLCGGISLTDGAPSKWIVNFPKELKCVIVSDSDVSSFKTTQEWIIEVDDFEEGSVKPTITITCNLFYCKRDVCSSKRFIFNIPVEKTASVKSKEVNVSLYHEIS